VADLVDDLGGLEVAREAQLAGRAERAADRAAGLARDAERVPLALAAPRRVVHEDALDERAVGEAVERLLGQAAVGEAELGVGDRVEAERRVELVAERGGECPRVGRGGRIAAPDRVGDLAGSVGRLATVREPGLERAGRETGDPGATIGEDRELGGHGASLCRGARATHDQSG